MKLQLIVPHYKEPQSVVECFLDSLALQRFVDFNDFEVLLINDGDECLLNKQLLTKYNFNINYIIKEHTGASSTREFGMKEATADYIMFCDCDDLFGSVDAMWRLLQHVKSGTADIVCSSYIRDCKPENGTINFIHYTADRVKTMCMIHGKLFKRSFLVEHNLHWPTQFQNRHEDFYFYSICLAEGPVIEFIESEVYIWKYRPASLSDHDIMSAQEQEIDRTKVELAVLHELKARNAMYAFKIKLIDLLFNTYCYSHIAKQYGRYEENFNVAVETYKAFLPEITTITQADVYNRVSALSPSIIEKLLFADLTFSNWINLLGRS